MEKSSRAPCEPDEEPTFGGAGRRDVLCGTVKALSLAWMCALMVGTSLVLRRSTAPARATSTYGTPRRR